VNRKKENHLRFNISKYYFVDNNVNDTLKSGIICRHYWQSVVQSISFALYCILFKLYIK